MLAICGRNVSLWDTKTCKLVDKFPKESAEDWEFIDISWSSDRKYLAVLRLFGPVELLTVEEEKIVSSQKLVSIFIPANKDAYPTSIAFMRNSSRYLAIGSKNGVIVWDCKANSIKKTLTFDGIPGQVEFLEFNSFGSHVAAGMSSGNVVVYEYSGTSKKLYQVPQSTRVTALRYQTHSSTVGVGSAEGHVMFWNTITGSEVGAILGAHRNAVADLAFAPNNAKLVATVCQDGQLCFHEMANRKPVVTCETGEVLTTIDMCADGVIAVTGTQSGRILSYDIRSLSYPMASFDLQTPIKKLRYARTTVAGDPALGSAAWRPAAGGVSTPLSQRPSSGAAGPSPVTPGSQHGYGIFSPLHSDSYLYSSSSSCGDASLASCTPGNLVSPVKSEVPEVKAECNEEIERHRLSIVQAVLRSSCSDEWLIANGIPLDPDDRNGNRTDDAAAFGGIPPPSSMITSFRIARDRLAFPVISEVGCDTSSPLQDMSNTLFPCTDPKTGTEISPIADVTAMTANLVVSSTSMNDTSDGVLDKNIEAERATVEQASDYADGVSRRSDDESSVMEGVWDSNYSSSDEEFHSQREEGTNRSAAAGQQASKDITEPLVSNQQLQQLLTQNFGRLFGELAEIRERLARLEALFPN